MNTILFQATIKCGQAEYFNGHYYVKNSYGHWFRWCEKDHISWIDAVPFVGY